MYIDLNFGTVGFVSGQFWSFDICVLEFGFSDYSSRALFSLLITPRGRVSLDILWFKVIE